MNKRNSLFAIGLCSFLALSTAIIVPTAIVEANKSKKNNTNVVDDSNNINELAINNIISEFQNINLDNYRLYFQGANNLPDTSDPGRMSTEIMSKISGIPIKALKTNGIKVQKSGDTNSGNLIVNISIELNSPYLYNGKSEIQINNVNTGMFDPNSEFNLGLFEISESSLNGFTTAGMNYEKTLYVPNIADFVFLGNYYFDNHSLKSKSISFEYADFYNFSSDYQQFINCPFQKISFKNSEHFNTFNNYGMFTNSSFLEEVDFENCVSLQAIFDTTFANCPKLSLLNFKNCKSLVNIGSQAFANCTSLEVLDFSDSPINNVASDAFVGCSNLKQIIVKKESLSYFEAAIKGSNINVEIVSV